MRNQKQEKDIEVTVNKLLKRMKKVSADTVIGEGITQGELVDVLKYMSNYISMAKFELGEDFK